ncbi:hypothetical protein [Streptomyces sioyaensis]|uniref:hypothetical protein n=1 Tax=Streptomyces sioyaensis TaxID=67364 RepID=UPI00379BBB86
MYSYGGLVALGMAVRQPGQVRSLTLIEPPAFTFDRDNPIVAEMARVNQRLFEDPTIAPADRLRQFFSLVGIDGKVPDPLPQPLLADLVLWEPKFFGVKTHMVLKGGQIAYAQCGDANASITTPQPYLPRPVWGSTGRAPGSNSVNFVAPDAAANLNKRFDPTRPSSNPGVETDTVRLHKKFVAIKDTVRDVKKVHMKLNNALPTGLEVDHNSFEVTIGGATTGDSRTQLDGVTIPRAYVTEVPMAQRYFLF